MLDTAGCSLFWKKIMKLLRIEKKIIDQVILVYMYHALLMIFDV